MQKYTYKAIDASGKNVSGTISAMDDKNFRDQIKADGLRCYDYKVVNSAKQQKNKPLPMKDVIGFSRQLSSMLSAGLDLGMSMKMLYERTEKRAKQLRNVLAKLFEELQKGESLASAMIRMDNTFPPLFISMVKSGEMNGKLDEALVTVSDYFERENIQHNKVKSAMNYPIILLSVCAVVVVLMSVFIIPKMTAMMPEGSEMPFPTAVLLGIRDFFVSKWYMVLFVILALVTLVPIIKKLPGVSMVWGKFKTKIPKIGRLQKQLYTASFSRSLATLYATGIPLLDAIAMSAEVINNDYVHVKIREAIISIRKGSTIAEAFAIVDAFDPMLMTMTFVGEQAGTLDEILMQTSRYFEEESQNAIKKLTGMINPAMMMIMGIVVAFILMGAMMPMFSMYDQIG